MVERPNARSKACRGVLGTQPRFHRPAVDAELVLPLRLRLPASNLQMPFEQIDAGDFLGHKGFDFERLSTIRKRVFAFDTYQAVVNNRRKFPPRIAPILPSE